MSPAGWALAACGFAAGLGAAYLMRRFRRRAQVSLPQAIRLVAADPNQATDAIFRAAVVRTPVLYLKLVDTNVPLQDGAAHTVAEGDDVQVPTQVGLNGEALLLTYCDLTAARQVESGANFLTLTTHDALAMVLKGGLDGLAIMNGEEGWGGVSAAGIPALLQRVPQVGVIEA